MTKEEALTLAKHSAERQRQSVRDLRTDIESARETGATWREIGEALNMPHQTVYRQFTSGRPIVTVREKVRP
jgi:hypothetical protein